MSTLTQLELLRHPFGTGGSRRTAPQRAQREFRQGWRAQQGFHERWNDGLATFAVVGLSLAIAFDVFQLLMR